MHKKPILFLLLCLLMVSNCALPVYAAGTPCEVQLEVENRVTGDLPDTEEHFRFVLEPVDGAPMPEKANVTVHGAGKGVFPSITYTEPGDFCYTLREIPGEAEGYTYDKTLYRLTVQVTTDEEGTLSAAVYMAAEGSEGKAEHAVFVNPYTKKPDDPPQTGDEGSLYLWTALGCFGLMGLLFPAFRVKKR